MATQVQNRRGTTAEHSTFTGAVGELTVDTTKDTVVVHDGAVAGGRPLLREDQSNLPTSAPTTGIYNASGSLAISTNSSERIRIGVNGEIGIGGANYGTSGQVLTSAGSGAAPTWQTPAAGNTDKIEEGNSSAEVIDTGSDGRFVVTTEGTERLRVDSSGRLGIGTSTPSAALSVVGAGSFTSQVSVWGGTIGQPQVVIEPGKVQSYSAGLGVGSLLLNSLGGNVGIGTTTPGALLDVAGSNGRLYLRDGSANTAKIVALNAAGTGAASLIFETFNLETARIDSSGRLLVGTSSTSGVALLQVQGYVGDTNGLGLLALRVGSSSPANGASLGRIDFNDSTDSRGASIDVQRDGGTWGASSKPSRLVFSTTADGASSPTERLRITNGGFIQITDRANDPLPDSTSPSGDNAFDHLTLSTTGVNVSRQAGAAIDANRRGASDGAVITLRRSGTQVGTISVSASATAYNTSSDYRLKENVTPVTDGISRLQQLKPSRFNFIVEPGKTVDGFLAHEAQAVVPECVTGEKDAVDADGNPIYQGIDQSKLVPLLTAALQEAVAKIESLEARLTAAGI